MFRIADGREQFYQWDLDRQVIVDDPSITEVHFCNRTDDCSLVTEVIDGKANVPNILLQSSFDIRVFGYDGKATMHDKKFKVIARTRPADYVYTETEIRNYSELSKRIDELEETNGIYRLVLPAEGEAVTDERTIEILMAFNNSLFGKDIPLCSYSHVLITNWAVGSSTITLTAVKPAIRSSSDYFTEYDLTFEYDSAIEAFIFEKVTSYTRHHVSKTSQLENDSDFTTKAYVDDAIANVEAGNVDLSDYYTKTETDTKIDEAVEAIDVSDKLDKLTPADDKDYAYIAQGSTGETALAVCAVKATASSIVKRDSNGAITASSPTQDGHVANKQYVDDALDDMYEATVIYRLVKPDSEPTPDSMDGNQVLITDAHTIEYLNRTFNGEAVLGYTWKIGLKNYLITDFTKAAKRLTLHAHRLMGATIRHFIFYMDIEDDGNWYWAGYQFDEYDIQKATEDAIQTAFDDVVTAEGGAY